MKPFLLSLHMPYPYIIPAGESVDYDDDTDIILGNFSKGFMNQDNFKPDWDTRLPFIMLENSTLKKP